MLILSEIKQWVKNMRSVIYQGVLNFKPYGFLLIKVNSLKFDGGQLRF